jgi:hypothetical protein
LTITTGYEPVVDLVLSLLSEVVLHQKEAAPSAAAGDKEEEVFDAATVNR